MIAILTTVYRGAALTKGRAYAVVDIDDWNGSYIILDDNGARKSIDWLCFSQQGKEARS